MTFFLKKQFMRLSKASKASKTVMEENFGFDDS